MVSKLFIEFNKEVMSGFIGAIIGAPLLSFFSTLFTTSINIISASAVLGDILGGAIFWVGTRLYDKSRKEKYTTKNLAGDIAFFTPAAFVIAIIISYPTIFLLSKYFLDHHIETIISVLISQVAAMSLFLIAMNIYRILLIKIVGKSFN